MSFETPGRYGSELATSHAQRWDSAAPDACRLTQTDWDRDMGTVLRRKQKSTPRMFTWRHLDHRFKKSIDGFETRFAPTTQLQSSPSRHAAAYCRHQKDTYFFDIVVSLSPIWPVPKHNRKQSLQGKGLVNRVRCVSRAFMRLSYKRQVASPCVYGRDARRWREEVLGAALDIQAECIRAGKSHLFELRDVLSQTRRTNQ